MASMEVVRGSSAFTCEVGWGACKGCMADSARAADTGSLSVR